MTNQQDENYNKKVMMEYIERIELLTGELNDVKDSISELRRTETNLTNNLNETKKKAWELSVKMFNGEKNNREKYGDFNPAS